ncbi:MAG: nucleotidyltransferase family protein [Bacteroidales bacterium]|nr:nucleotidyltransferase family protein [Bacteroidales bacterium]
MKYTIDTTASVQDALALLESNDIQTLFVTDAEGHMKGTLSDGDVRRGMLVGARMDSPVSDVMHRDFKFLRKEAFSVADIKAFREKRILFIPILDREDRIVDTVNLVRYRSRLPLTAVLMAGGKGERLRPLTEHTPKPLLPVGDKAIIDHNVDRLLSFGIRDIHVTVNYLAGQIESHFAAPRDGVSLHCHREPAFLGTIGSLRLIPDLAEDTVLVMNSDLFTNIDIEDFYLHFREHGADLSVAAVPYNVSIPYGILDLDGRDVKGIIEKPVFNYYVGAGIYLMKKSVIREIPEGERFHATDLISRLIAGGRKVIRYPLNGTWIDIGTLREYQKANDLIRHL